MLGHFSRSGHWSLISGHWFLQESHNIIIDLAGNLLTLIRLGFFETLRTGGEGLVGPQDSFAHNFLKIHFYGLKDCTVIVQLHSKLLIWKKNFFHDGRFFVTSLFWILILAWGGLLHPLFIFAITWKILVLSWWNICVKHSFYGTKGTFVKSHFITLLTSSTKIVVPWWSPVKFWLFEDR